MRLIPLTRGLAALVDDADYDHLAQWRWYAQRAACGWYAARRLPASAGRALVFMHRVVNGTPDGLLTDHADGDGLNNTRANLRSATPSQNMMNRRAKRSGSSHFKGVSKDVSRSGRRPWRAAIRLGGKNKYLGWFATEDAAASAYAAAAQRHYGEFHSTRGSLP